MEALTAVTVRREAYERDGFAVARGLLSPSEAAGLCGTFMAMHAAGGVAGRYAPPPPDRDHDDGFHHTFRSGDPLLRWPRVMLPHDFMEDVRRMALDARFFDAFADVLGEEALLVYSMFYFKPAGARGQAFHQDNFYIKVKPATCHAAWVACDPSDGGNGGLMVVPESHRMDIVCPEVSDPANYFAKELVRPPAGLTAVQLELAPGDVLLFHGNLIHGSEPNRSADRFRRSLIFHYMPASSVEVARYDVHPLDRHGRPVAKAEAAGGGPCGTPHEIRH